MWIALEWSPERRSGLNQACEFAFAVQRRQFLEAANVGIAEENLRHGVPAGSMNHLAAQGRIQVHAQLVDRSHTARRQQTLGTNAKRAHRRGVHANWHAHLRLPAYLRTGSPASRHAATP